MKLLLLCLRVPVVLLLSAWIWCVWFYDLAREAAHKRRLGSAYEGPLDNPDLR